MVEDAVDFEVDGESAMPPDAQPSSFPWSGTIVPWSAALRSKPAPHAHTLADLPRGTSIKVIHRVNGWLFVEWTPEGKKASRGYVSRERLGRKEQKHPPHEFERRLFASRVNDYGARVKAIYDGKLWKK